MFTCQRSRFRAASVKKRNNTSLRERGSCSNSTDVVDELLASDELLRIPIDIFWSRFGDHFQLSNAVSFFIDSILRARISKCLTAAKRGNFVKCNHVY